MSKEDEILINGSGLFYFDSGLSDETKLKIVKWYNELPKEQREYVDILREEKSNMCFYEQI